MRAVLALVSIVLPWRLRRQVLRLAFGYRLHPTSRIGLSWTFPREELVLEQNARIRHFTVIRGLDRVHVGASSVIGSLNWITGIPINWDDPVLEDYPDRRAELVLGESEGITSRHYIDCSDAVVLGSFALVAGVRYALLAHHLNVHRARRDALRSGSARTPW